MKSCSKCKEAKALKDFYWKNKKKDYTQPKCKQCLALIHKVNGKLYREKNREAILARKREWYLKNKDTYRNGIYKRLYGISLLEYNKIHKKQEYQCAICKINTKRPDVDHCHKTKEIRGLLCNACNRLLSAARDNTKTLKNAINYLTGTNVKN